MVAEQLKKDKINYEKDKALSNDVLDEAISNENLSPEMAVCICDVSMEEKIEHNES